MKGIISNLDEVRAHLQKDAGKAGPYRWVSALDAAIDIIDRLEPLIEAARAGAQDVDLCTTGMEQS